jgi:hypothetical protein
MADFHLELVDVILARAVYRTCSRPNLARAGFAMIFWRSLVF